MGDELLSDQRRIAREQLRRPDQQIIVDVQRQSRAWARATAGFFAALVIGSGIAFFVKLGPWLREQPVTQDILVVLFFLLPVGVAFVAMARVPPAPLGANEERIVRKTADLHQARARWGMLAMIFVIFTSLPGILLFDSFGRNNTTHPAILSFASAVVVAMTSVVIVGMAAVMFLGRGVLTHGFLNDELTISLKRRAMQLGYFLTLVLFAGFGVAARFDAAHAAHFMPFGLGASVVIPCLYFIFLDWKASRGG